MYLILCAIWKRLQFEYPCCWLFHIIYNLCILSVCSKTAFTIFFILTECSMSKFTISVLFLCVLWQEFTVCVSLLCAERHSLPLGYPYFVLYDKVYNLCILGVCSKTAFTIFFILTLCLMTEFTICVSLNCAFWYLVVYNLHVCILTVCSRTEFTICVNYP